MALLVSLTKQQSIKPISTNNTDRYTQIATEVEQLEVRKLIGVELLQDLIASPTGEWNAKLLNGGALESGATHKGLCYVIAYFNYSRYIGESYIKDTFTGFKKQKNEESEYLSEGEIKRLQNINREIAMVEWQLIEEWLNENSDQFEKWQCAETQKVYTPKLYSIRKTAK